MRVLLTGASSFTGCWFAEALVRGGHDVVCTMTRGRAHDYDEGVRWSRVSRVDGSGASVEWGCRFGDEKFLGLVGSGGFDVICHHAADVTNYKSPDFDAVGALANNVAGLGAVLESFKANGGSAFVLTGSVFERGEGAGSEGLPHFSPYGVSKALTAEVAAYGCSRRGVPFGKFVIPNPFGPLEEPRFTAYLIKTWAKGETPGVNTPAYVRDNIHVSALARAYAAFVGRMASEKPPFEKVSPSGYVESQGRFAERFAAEMAPRLKIDCPVELAHQKVFDEPRIRIGVDPVTMTPAEESAAWDAIAEDYSSRVINPDDAIRVIY